MNLIKYYVQLILKFSQSETSRTIKLTRAAIAKELHCSERNVIHILNKMEERQWIKRTVGRGRGNLSTITFKKTLAELFQELNSPTYHEIEQLIELLTANQMVNEQNNYISTLVFKLFGLKTQTDEASREEFERLKIPYFRQLEALDPAQAQRQTERHIVEQIFNTIVVYNPETKIIEPAISHYWEKDSEGKVWTFYLRKGVLFHNDKLVEAEDVKFTFERLAETSANWLVKDLQTIKCLGKYVVQFRFSVPIICWDLLICSIKCSIIPVNYGGKTHTEFSKEPIGTGAYKITKHEPNLLVLTVHQRYFQERAHIEEISFHVLPTIEKYLNVQEIEHEPLFYIPFTTTPRQEINFKKIERKNLSVKYLMWNMRKENHFFRKKITAILNRNNLVTDLGYPRYEPTTSFTGQNDQPYPLPEAFEHANNEDAITLLTYDLTPNNEDIKWIQQECQKYGISIEIKTVPYAKFLIEAREADLVLSEYVTEEVEENGLFHLFYSESSVIHQLIDRAELEKNDTFFYQAIQQENTKARMEIIKRLEAKLLTEMIVFPLYTTFQTALYHKKLMGITLTSIGLIPFKDLFYLNIQSD